MKDITILEIPTKGRLTPKEYGNLPDLIKWFAVNTNWTDNKKDRWGYLYFYKGILFASKVCTLIKYDNGDVIEYVVSEQGPGDLDIYPNMDSEIESEADRWVNEILKSYLQKFERYEYSLRLKTLEILERNGLELPKETELKTNMPIQAAQSNSWFKKMIEKFSW